MSEHITPLFLAGSSEDRVKNWQSEPVLSSRLCNVNQILSRSHFGTHLRFLKPRSNAVLRLHHNMFIFPRRVSKSLSNEILNRVANAGLSSVTTIKRLTKLLLKYERARYIRVASKYFNRITIWFKQQFQDMNQLKRFVSFLRHHWNSERKPIERPLAISRISIIFCLDISKNVFLNIDSISTIFFNIISLPCFETKQTSRRPPHVRIRTPVD
ncbi:hypothetical protein RF11_12276 [Thelohanellus kitauei]|uniref:Uncharacterized protein n=1 Tax=Thelohanellus kitauei TaxID=669202 RepID=A0A0C2NDT6_THEKT|nr:hypothetical protein RF11_12276 [Thelohanellus kitauei]